MLSKCGAGLLKVPWTSRRPNQSILREINPEYSLEGLMLKVHYLGHLMWTVDLLENYLMLGKIESRGRRGCQRIRWLDSITNAVDMNLGKFWEMVRDREDWCTVIQGVAKSQTWLDDWKTILNYIYIYIYKNIFILLLG